MNLTSLDVLEGRVQRGAQLLDLNRPGWAREVEVEILEVSCPAHSVSGQLFGPDIVGQMNALGIEGDGVRPWSRVDAFADHGFAIANAEVVIIPDSIRDRMNAIAVELSALVGRDVSEAISAPEWLPIPRDPDVVTQEAFTVELLWHKAILSRR